MDSQTYPGKRPGITIPGEETFASFSDLEHRFLTLLKSNVGEARNLFLFIKRETLELSAQDNARKDRLIGRYYEATADYARALEWTQKARTAFAEIADQAGVYQCMLTMLGTYIHSGRLNKARRFAQEMLAMANLPEEHLKIHINLGALEHRLHRYRPALDHFKIASNLLQHNPALEGFVLYNMANVLVCLNKFSEAERHYQRALTVFADQPLAKGHVLQALGHLYSILGQYFLAETRLKEAHQTYQEGGDKAGAALCDLDRFHLKIRLNKAASALEEVDALMGELSGLELTYEVGLLCYHASTAAVALNDVELAEDFLDEAISLFVAEDNRHYLALCTLLQGMLCLKQKQTDDARDHFRMAHKIFCDKKLGELELECLIYLFLVDDRLPDAKEFRRLRTLLARPIGHRVRIQALLIISNYWYQRGQLKKAIEARFEAIATIEETRASIISEDLRESFFADKSEVYEPLVEWLFQWNNPKAPALIFKVLGLSRSRQFSERLSLSEELPPVLNREEPALLEMNKLQARLDQLNRKLEDFHQGRNTSEEEKAAVLDSYDETTQKLTELKRTLADEARLGLYFPVEISPDELRRFLPAGCVVVSFFIGSQTFYRAELDHDHLQTYHLPLPGDFRKNLNLLSNLLSNRIFGQGDKIKELVQSLSPFLMPNLLANNSAIVFVPHKNLQTFPFALLRHASGYLLETHRISLCPNLATLYFTLKKEAPVMDHPVFFFSQHPDDPGAPERHFLQKRFPEAEVFADLDQGRAEVLGSDFIHFAGHCYFNRKAASQSYLQMAGRPLYLSELKDLRLKRGPFINLASCQSGSIVLEQGNEPYGFVASFFAIGATNILASNWEIDDEATGKWMAYFYGNLDLGLTHAYRFACLMLMREHPEPYYWAGFSLLGKPW